MIELRHRPNPDLIDDAEDELDREVPTRAAGKLARTARLYRDGLTPVAPTADLSAVLRAAATSAGFPLPPALLKRLERALQADLSRVRLHTGPQAAAAAAALRANAFTVGTDVFFAAGGFDPSSRGGERLIAHEVAHVVQTGARGPALGAVDAVEVSDPGEHAEVAAHDFADDFVAGPPAATAPARLRAPASAAHATRVLRDAAPASAAPAGAAGGKDAAGAAPMSPEAEAALKAALDGVPAAAPAGAGAAGAAPGVDAGAAADGAAATGGAPAAEASAGAGGAGGPEGAAAPGAGGAPGAAAGGGAAPASAGGAGSAQTAAGGAGGAPATAGGGGGGGAEPAAGGAAPSAQAAPHAAGDAADGMVDYYMETHWNDAHFLGLVAQHGYPSSAPKEAITELDRWMPTDTPASVRSTVNLVAGIGLGVFDGLFWSGLKAIPIVGNAFAVVDTVRQVAEQVGKYQEVGDWGGGTLAVLRAICDGGASIADNVANTAGFIEGACFILAGILGIGAVATALAGVGVVVGVVAAVIAEIGLACKVIKVVARSISAVLNGVKVVLDYVLLLYNASKAEEAEAAGDFAKAAKYKQLMQGNAIDMVTDGIATVGDSIEAVIGIIGMGGGVSTVAKIGTKIGGAAFGAAADTANKYRKAAGRVLGGPGGGANPLDALNGGAGGASGVGGLNDVVDGDIEVPIMVPTPIGAIPVGSQTVNFADQMRTSDAYVDPARAGGGSGPIAAARQQTLAQLQGAQQGLGSTPIDWYQKLVNEVIAPAESSTATSIADNMKPSTWIMAALGGIRNLLGMIGADSLDSIAGAADTASGWLNSKLQPMIAQINQFMAGAKPRMTQMLEAANQKIQASQLNLERVRGLITSLGNGARKVEELTGQNGIINQKYDEMMAKADTWRVTRASLGLPASVPIPFVDGRIDAAISGINAPVDTFKAVARTVKTLIVDRIQAAITSAAQWVQQKMAAFNRQLSEGGAAHTVLTEQYNRFKQLFDRATKAFAGWDGQLPQIDISGAGGFLRQVAAASRRARELEAEARPDPWKDIARNEGQTFVNTWRGAHGDQIAKLYQPTPSPAEMAAVTSVYNATRPHATGEAAQALEAAYARCQAAAGTPGRRGLYALWAAENDLIAAAALVNTQQAAGSGGSGGNGTGGSGGSGSGGNGGGGGGGGGGGNGSGGGGGGSGSGPGGAEIDHGGGGGGAPDAGVPAGVP